MIAALVATFRELARPTIGIRTRCSAAAIIASLSPAFSAPTAIATGPR